MVPLCVFASAVEPGVRAAGGDPRVQRWQAQLEGLGVPCGPDMPSPKPGAVSGASDCFPGDSAWGVFGQLLVVATGGLSRVTLREAAGD